MVPSADPDAQLGLQGTRNVHDAVEQMPEHEAFTESVVDEIDRMRNDGGLAPELPHRRPQDVPQPDRDR